jgi:hypothetical protein
MPIMKQTKFLFFSLVVIISLVSLSLTPASFQIPVTGLAGSGSASAPYLPTLQEFASTLSDAGRPAGIYTPFFAYPIIQQPDGNPGFVSSEPDIVTQFSLAIKYGTTGILAHNTLAGARFSQLHVGQFITLVYSDGRLEYYEVSNIESYQALSPGSTTSTFLSLQQPGMSLTSTQLFNRIYAAGKKLVLQTCIAANGIDSWGRLFVIATPILSSTLPTIQHEAQETWVVGRRFKVI